MHFSSGARQKLPGFFDFSEDSYIEMIPIQVDPVTLFFLYLCLSILLRGGRPAAAEMLLERL